MVKRGRRREGEGGRRNKVVVAWREDGGGEKLLCEGMEMKEVVKEELIRYGR